MPMLAFDEGALIPIVAIIGGTIIVLALFVRSALITRAREHTKRELAAYVAEGAMDGETAIALANAGKDSEDEEA